MTVLELLNMGSKTLETVSETPRLDASLILAWSLGVDRAKLFSMYQDSVPSNKESLFLEKNAMRQDGHPVAYILGEKEFFGHNFFVKNGILIPRPDTETLVEGALEIIKQNNLKSVLDMCTGTGCIAISIYLENKNLLVTASDISPISLEVFNINNQKLTNSKISFISSNLFENINSKFDIIVTNPPYLSSRENNERMDGGWKEPSLALDGGEDGLDIIRIIISDTVNFLNKQGWLLIEAAPWQMDDMATEMKSKGFGNIEFLMDLENRRRVIVGRYG
jgi:release factor glutamine methyltransferase